MEYDGQLSEFEVSVIKKGDDMKKETMEKLAAVKDEICVTITLNTHRTKPDYLKDRIVLKNLCREAENRVIEETGKRPAARLLSKLAAIPEEIDYSLSLDSLHLFLSNSMTEIVRSSWPAHADTVMVSDHFALRPLIYAVTRTEEYMILLLSQGGVQLFYAINDKITEEVRNEQFPFGENPHFHTDRAKLSNPELVDNMVREFLNKIDKAVMKIWQKTGLDCVVISTEDNFSRLLQVADKPEIYAGYARINYNNTAGHFITKQAWDLIKKQHKERVSAALKETKEAVAAGRVITDLQEVYSAAKAGRGDLLITHYDYMQPVELKAYDRIEPVRDPSLPGVIEDITSLIAWEVWSGKGRVYFTYPEELKGLGDISLKVRY